MKTFNNLFYTGLTIVGVPIILIAVSCFFAFRVEPKKVIVELPPKVITKTVVVHDTVRIIIPSKVSFQKKIVTVDTAHKSINESRKDSF